MDTDGLKKQALTAYFVGHGGRMTPEELARTSITDVEFVRAFLDEMLAQGKVTKDGDYYVQVKQV